MGTIEVLEKGADPITLNSPTVASIFRQNGSKNLAPPTLEVIRKHLQDNHTKSGQLEEVADLLLRHRDLLVPISHKKRASCSTGNLFFIFKGNQGYPRPT